MIMKKIQKILNIELIFFIAGLIYLAIINPFSCNHLHFCIFGYLGLDFCPGCGLGRSVSFLLHGCLLESISEHPLGVVGLVLILNRIYTLSIKYFTIIH
jgi:TM2 domain-containing membrane protein YozV